MAKSRARIAVEWLILGLLVGLPVAYAIWNRMAPA
jgi:hypothetical protein